MIVAGILPGWIWELWDSYGDEYYGGFKLEVWLSPNIQRPQAAKLCVRPPKVLEVQERARGPLSPCQVWWGSDFTRRRGGQKRWVFCLFVCLFLCSSPFWTSEIVRQISLRRRWTMEMILMPLDRGRFVVVHRVQLFQTVANWRQH